MLKVSQTANRLIKQHGETAPYVAAERATEMQKAGDRESEVHWTNVVIETKLLLARDYGW
jgi:hypothetical protein